MSDRKENLRIVFDVVRDKYNAVAGVDSSLDGKSGVLLGFEITLGIGYASFALDKLVNMRLAEAIIGLTALGISIVLLIVAHWPRAYYYAASINEAEKYIDRSEEDLLSMLINKGHEAINKNRAMRKIRRILYRNALILLIASSFFLVLAKI